MEQDLTLREALAEDHLDDFVQQEEDKGVELANDSEFERALGLLIVPLIRPPETNSSCPPEKPFVAILASTAVSSVVESDVVSTAPS